MKKIELVKAIGTKVTEATGKKVTQAQAEVLLNAFAEVLTDALVAGEDVKIPTFGTFKTADVAERTGTIQMGDKKGSQYVVPAHRTARFKVATELKNALNA